MIRRRIICALALLCLLAGCRQQRLESADIQFEMSVSDRRVGETTLLVQVSDREGKAVSDPGVLSVRGDMAHAGMAPVFTETDRSNNGFFEIPFYWSMGGSWVVEAKLTLPNGDVTFETFKFEILSEAMEDDTMETDHGAMTGESSAVYLRIRNRGDDDVTILSAASAAAANAAFHLTVVEDDMARMEAVDSLLIPAGGTVELAPGGMHIMLTGLTADLPPDGALAMRLECDSGEVYELDIPVMNMLMSELDDAVEIGDLVFSNRWARPAQAGMTTQATPSG